MKKKLFIALIISGTLGAFSLWALPQTGNLLQMLRTFTQVLKLIEENYVQQVKTDDLFQNAIKGMLSKLDPHSNYLDPKLYKELKIHSEGKYGGLGFQFGIIKNHPTIISPMEGTPAYRAGLQAGDVITKIDGISTKGMGDDESMSKMRGKPGTKVTLTIARENAGAPFDLTITRDFIKIKNIPYAGLIGTDIGYIRLLSFSENVGEDVRKAIDSLVSVGAKKFILDLRLNPGGLLDEAVKVSENFLPQGKLIVSTKGRNPQMNRDYYSTKPSKITGRPLVILVDKGSASASEIVAGAVQDQDAGLIAGDTTFGKGSVQTVVPVDSGAIKLTTARYYTPCGKCIDMADTSEFIIRNPTLGKKYTTLGSLARELTSSGAIIPDLVLKAQPIIAPLTIKIYKENLIFQQFALKYTKSHPKLTEDFRIDDAALTEFQTYIKAKDIKFTDAEFDSAKPDLQKLLRQMIATEKWGTRGGYYVSLQQDIWIKDICELLNKSDSQTELFKIGGVK
ncbi:MAG: S41 family peptidase [bacterium]|nr:S41 family peptidase [bacterium]